VLIDDSFEVPTSTDQVWAFFQDMPRVGACLPGMESVTESAPDHYQGVLKVSLGPISARFQGNVKLVERDVVQRRMVAQVEGQDKTSGTSVKATFTSRLIETEGGTRVEYSLDVALRGRLATFGSAVVQATARKMTVDFARCVEEALAA
jgi:carbon monoxide dehydrogenase subunit G